MALRQRLPRIEESKSDINDNVQHNIEKEPSGSNIVSCNKPADATPLSLSDEVTERKDPCQQSHCTPEKPESISHKELDELWDQEGGYIVLLREFFVDSLDELFEVEWLFEDAAGAEEFGYVEEVLIPLGAGHGDHLRVEIFLSQL